MRKMLFSFIVLIPFNIHALENRIYTKINSSSAKVKIQTEIKEKVDAIDYADGVENTQFVNDMLLDKNSILFKLKSQIEKDNCSKNSTADKAWIEGCGQVTLTKEVRTSFGRNGQMSCGGSYTFFVGFTNEGSGKYFDVSHMVTISETADVEIKKDGTFSGVVNKSLNLVKYKKIDDLTP